MEKFIIPLSDGVPLTIVELTERHFWRIHAIVDEGVEYPKPPEGYSISQATENLPTFQKKVQEYNQEIQFRKFWRAVGSARLMALDKLPEAKEEQPAIQKLCNRYSFYDPDKQEDPLNVGMSIWEIISDLTNNPLVITEAYLWLQEKAGGINHEQVEEILKRVQPDSQRDADTAGSGSSDGSAEQGKADPEVGRKPAVRGRRNRI